MQEKGIPSTIWSNKNPLSKLQSLEFHGWLPASESASYFDEAPIASWPVPSLRHLSVSVPQRGVEGTENWESRTLSQCRTCTRRSSSTRTQAIARSKRAHTSTISNRHYHTSAHPATGDSSRAGRRSVRARPARCHGAAIAMRFAASDVAFEADVGPAADLGMLARAPKLVGSASLLHEVAAVAVGQGAHIWRGRGAMLSRSCVARRARSAGGGRVRCGGRCGRAPLAAVCDS